MIAHVRCPNKIDTPEGERKGSASNCKSASRKVHKRDFFTRISPRSPLISKPVKMEDADAALRACTFTPRLVSTCEILLQRSSTSSLS